MRRKCRTMMASLSAIVANLHRVARHIHAHVVVAPGEEETVAFAAEAASGIGGDDELAGARVVNAGGEFRERPSFDRLSRTQSVSASDPVISPNAWRSP